MSSACLSFMINVNLKAYSHGLVNADVKKVSIHEIQSTVWLCSNLKVECGRHVCTHASQRERERERERESERETLEL